MTSMDTGMSQAHALERIAQIEDSASQQLAQREEALTVIRHEDQRIRESFVPLLEESAFYFDPVKVTSFNTRSGEVSALAESRTIEIRSEHTSGYVGAGRAVMGECYDQYTKIVLQENFSTGAVNLYVYDRVVGFPPKYRNDEARTFSDLDAAQEYLSHNVNRIRPPSRG